MKKSIIKGIYAVLIFVTALFIIDHIMNKGNTDITTEMEKATYPLVYVVRAEEKVNGMHGYSQQMDTSYQCETITPVDVTDRRLNLLIDTYGNQITQVAYEVRSVDGERLVEDTRAEGFVERDGQIALELTLKDLLEVNTEYSFLLSLTDSNGRVIYYYTNIAVAQDAYHVDDELQFALDFHSRTFDKERAQEITRYLESNAEGDNTTYSRVTIHSSFSQITWGSLGVKKETEPEIYVRQINPYVSKLELRYIVSLKEELDTNYYNVTEYYYLRYGTERMYLLDYERTMNSIFLPQNSIYTNNKISLGITDENLEMDESEDGNIFAFVKEDRLYSFNLTDNKLALLFAFYDEENADARTLYNNNNIHIISVDETGNVRFLVYGYMNRGTHEGGVGVTSYYYNSMLNTIEEEIYIPYSGSAGLIEKDIEQLAYVNNSNQLFLILDSSIYRIDLAMKSYEVLVENLPFGSYKVSGSNRMVVWQDGSDANASAKLELLNLNTGNQTEIEAGSSRYVKPIGFMNEDLIYGLAYRSDISRDNFGTTIFPMYNVRIQDEKGNILKNYEKTGIYVIDAAIEENQISLKRVRSSGETNVYVEIEDDQILNDAKEESAKNSIETAVTQEYEKIVQIAAKTSFKVSNLKYLTPKQVMYEGERQLHIAAEEKETACYYIYDKYGIQSVVSKPNEAVVLAEERKGKVLDQKGHYIWEKSNRSQVNQIMRITEDTVSEQRSAVAVCLDTILKYEGISRNSEYLLTGGNSVFSILQENLEDTHILDLSGCSLDSVLYYVGRDIPVMALLNDGNAVLLVGYNELNTVIFNPVTGKISKMGMNDSIAYFEANGNNFITYVR